MTRYGGKRGTPRLRYNGGMAFIRKPVQLKHRPNLASETRIVEFSAGETVTILEEWTDRFFIKNCDGLVFNVPKEFVNPE